MHPNGLHRLSPLSTLPLHISSSKCVVNAEMMIPFGDVGPRVSFDLQSPASATREVGRR